MVSADHRHQSAAKVSDHSSRSRRSAARPALRTLLDALAEAAKVY